MAPAAARPGVLQPLLACFQDLHASGRTVMACWHLGTAWLAQARKLRRDERGVTMVEYCLIAAMVALVAIVGISSYAGAIFSGMPRIVAAFAK